MPQKCLYKVLLSILYALTLCVKENKSLVNYKDTLGYFGIDVNVNTTMFVFLLALHNGPLRGKGSFTWKY